MSRALTKRKRNQPHGVLSPSTVRTLLNLELVRAVLQAANFHPEVVYLQVLRI
eukprot:jgi/Phyca11/509004/fgenesh2_kg.PHYCAscaffold_40_\